MPNAQAEPQTTPQAKEYQAMKNRLFLFNLTFQFFFLIIFTATGWSHGLKCWLIQTRDDFFSLNALYFSFFSFIVFVISFPMDFYEGYVLEHRYQLSRQSLFAWLKDAAKKSVIGFAVSLIVVEAVYFFLSEFPENWWLWAAFFWFFVSVVLARVFPKLILPLFFRSQPLPAGVLKEKLTALLIPYKMRLKEILVLDFSKKTVKANAMVAGLGASKQIFLSDTLVNEFTPEEIESVLAHEVGHYVNHDTLKMVLVGLLAALASFFAVGLIFGKLIDVFGFSAVSDIAGLPLLLALLMITGLLLLPAQNGYARSLERQADLFALKATQNPGAFISMMRRLAEKNFSDISPSRIIEIFLYDHPPISRRIREAEAFALSAQGSK
jgi:STE24 endopeptidase